MDIKNGIIIGFGEIGKAIYKKIAAANLDEYVLYVRDLKIEGIADGQFDILHICYPQHDAADFLMSIANYVNEYEPKAVIIHSTISLDVVDKLYGAFMKTPIYHCPIRGTHGQIEQDLDNFPIYFAPINNKAKEHELYELIERYLINIFRTSIVNVIPFKSGKETALAKLLSVVWYGYEIAFVQHVKRLCDLRGINFEQAYTEYFKSDEIWLNAKYKLEGKIPRPIFYPGVIGGKCVIQDVKLLEQNLPKICNLILESNDKTHYQECIVKQEIFWKCPDCNIDLRFFDILGGYCSKCKKEFSMVELDQARSGRVYINDTIDAAGMALKEIGKKIVKLLPDLNDQKITKELFEAGDPIDELKKQINKAKEDYK